MLLQLDLALTGRADFDGFVLQGLGAADLVDSYCVRHNRTLLECWCGVWADRFANGSRNAENRDMQRPPAERCHTTAMARFYGLCRSTTRGLDEPYSPAER